MKLYIHNTLQNTLEEFIPLMEDPNYKGPTKDYVGLYSCGPTVYNTATIGNLRTFQLSDLIKNVIKHVMGYPVKHVMNLTDVGHLVGDGDAGQDKMEKGAQREGLSARDIAQKYTDEFFHHMELLNNTDIDEFPKATDHILQQINMVKKLTAKGLTYIIPDDGIYFDTDKIDDYGKLLPAGHLEGLKSGARVEDHGKNNMTDFALWKFSPRNEVRQMEWIYDGERAGTVLTQDNRSTLTDEEQATRGFPGWHIECSAMATEYLGTNFDIHTGGIDLKTTHHTNEICQSEHSVCDAAHGPWVKYWIHGQFITVDGKKMGKSLGNAFTLEDVMQKGYHPVDLRFFYFGAYYSNFQDFSWDALERERKTRSKLQQKLAELHSKYGTDSLQDFATWQNLKNTLTSDASVECIAQVEKALLGSPNEHGLNMPLLLGNIHSMVNAMSKGTTSIEDSMPIIRFLDEYIIKCDLFALVDGGADIQEIPQSINDLAQARILAKQAKDYAKADALREEIRNAGYEIHDTADGYTIEKNHA